MPSAYPEPPPEVARPSLTDRLAAVVGGMPRWVRIGLGLVFAASSILWLAVQETPPGTSGLSWFGEVYGLPDWLGIVAVLALLVVLVNGPSPTLGTRYFWFWLLSSPAGMLFWSLRELVLLDVAKPWAPDRRLRGLTGFVLSIVLGGLVRVAFR